MKMMTSYDLFRKKKKIINDKIINEIIFQDKNSIAVLRNKYLRTSRITRK